MARKDKPSIRIIKEQVIEFYRDNPMLYDKTHPNYKAVIHEEVLGDLAGRLSIEVKEIMQYWTNLKSNYQSKLREMKLSNISGTGAGDERFNNRKTKPEDWEYFQLLSFLKDSIESQGRLSACNMPKIVLKNMVLSPPKNRVLPGQLKTQAAPRGFLLQQGATDGRMLCIITKDQLSKLAASKNTLTATANSGSSASCSVPVKKEHVIEDTKLVSWSSSLLKLPAKTNSLNVTMKQEPEIQMPPIEITPDIPTQIKKEVPIAIKPEIEKATASSPVASSTPQTSNYKKRKMEDVACVEAAVSSVGNMVKSQVAPMQQATMELINVVKSNASSRSKEPASSACAVQMKGLAMQMENLPPHVQDELLLSFMQQVMKAKRDPANL